MAKSPAAKINPEVLQWARKVSSYSLIEAAKKIGISDEKLEKMEAGELVPSLAQLYKISNVYKRPTALFFFSKIPQEQDLPRDYRVLSESEISKLSPDTRIEIRKAQRKREIAVNLSTQLGVELPEFKFQATLNDDVETLAKQFRKQINLDYNTQINFKSEYEAFNYWKIAIEELGILVFQASLESLDQLRGLAIYDKYFPLIMLNTKDSPRGKIFSLLHEVCHLFLHRSAIGNMNPNENSKDELSRTEVFCNEFAGECLVPSELLMKEQEVQTIRNEVSDKVISVLSKRYEASWEVVLRRLLKNKKISKKFYEAKREELFIRYKKIKTKGGPVPYDVKVMNYNGDPFTRIVFDSYNNKVITISDVSNYLGVKTKHLEKLEDSIRRKNLGAFGG